jgi:hypothetical protein
MGKSLIQEIMSLGDLPETQAIQRFILVLDHFAQAPESPVSRETL